MEGLDPKLINKLKDKIQRELVQRERETLEFWLAEIQKIYQKKHTSLEELKSELKLYIEKMKNRLEIIKTKGY